MFYVVVIGLGVALFYLNFKTNHSDAVELRRINRRLLQRVIRNNQALCQAAESITSEHIPATDPPNYRDASGSVRVQGVRSDLIVCHLRLRALDLTAEFGTLRDQRKIATLLQAPICLQSEWLGKINISVLDYHCLAEDLLKPYKQEDSSLH